jgi:tetratricopeptide (TPR) repeat protein
MTEYENMWWQFNLNDARKLLEEILQENPDYSEAYRKMAFIEYYYYENYDKALYLIHVAINKEPEEKDNYSLLGDIYFACDKFDKAIESFVKAIEFDSLDSELYYSVGKSFVKKGNKTESEFFLEKAVHLNNFNLNANKILHLLYVENEEYEKAYNIWKKDHLIVKGRKPIGFLEKWHILYENVIENKSLNFHYEMGKLYTYLLLYDEAKLEFEKALKTAPDNNEINEKLNEVTLFIDFRDRLKDFFISYYRKRIIIGEKEEKGILDKLLPIYQEMLVLFPDIKSDKFNEDWLYEFNRKIENKFKVIIKYGHANKIFNCHFGYVISDTLENVSQWGKEGKLRIIVLNNMVTNGFSAWYWNYLAQDGGWTSSDPNQANIVTVVMDPKYCATTNRWKDATNKEKRKGIIDDNKMDANLINKPCLEVFYSSFLRYQFQFKAIDEAIERGKTKYGSEDEIQFYVNDLIFDHYYTTTTLIHEGQHALDNLYFKFEQWELEYRAKLSEIVYGNMTFLSLSDILGQDIGNEDLPHGKANTRIFKEIVKTINKNREKYSGINTDKNILMQLINLDSREIARIAKDIFEIEYIKLNFKLEVILCIFLA